VSRLLLLMLKWPGEAARLQTAALLAVPHDETRSRFDPDTQRLRRTTSPSTIDLYRHCCTMRMHSRRTCRRSVYFRAAAWMQDPVSYVSPQNQQMLHTGRRTLQAVFVGSHDADP
jgi:hypothetical protein